MEIFEVFLIFALFFFFCYLVEINFERRRVVMLLYVVGAACISLYLFLSDLAKVLVA